MREYANDFIEGTLTDTQGTVISSWYDGGDNWEHYFTLYTTQDLEEETYAPNSETEIRVESISFEEILQKIPEEFSGGYVSGESSTTFASGDTKTFEFKSDVRMQFRTSQDMQEWGQSWPALCFEHWIEEDSDREISADDENELLDTLKEELGICLRDHDEYVGNIIVSIENQSCRATFNEGPEELLTVWSSDDGDLTDSELLTLLDSWEIDLNGIEKEQVEITLRREEFGNVLYEKEIPLSEESLLSTEEAVQLAEESIIAPTVKLVSNDESARYKLDSFEAPGASDEILKISQNGRLLDEYSCPLIRQVDTTVELGLGSASSNGRTLPPTLFEEPTYSTGQRLWNPIVSSEAKGDFETWIVDDPDDYDEVMDLIYDQLSGPVKLSEPYLRPERLDELIQEGEQDLDLWVVLGHKQNYLNSMRSDFEQCVSKAASAGKGLHILWLPGDQSTPLHDRFLLNEEGGLIIGTSFNSLDSNITVVSEIPEDQSQELEVNFDYWWNSRTFRRQHDVELIDST